MALLALLNLRGTRRLPERGPLGRGLGSTLGLALGVVQVLPIAQKRVPKIEYIEIYILFVLGFFDRFSAKVGPRNVPNGLGLKICT